MPKGEKKTLEDQMSQNWIMGKFTGNLLMYREKPWFLAYVPFTQSKNGE